MEIKIIKREGNKRGYFIKHKAIVEIVEDFDIEEQKEEVLEAVTNKSGYYANAFGLYGGSVKATAKENQYLVIWETGASCD